MSNKDNIDAVIYQIKRLQSVNEIYRFLCNSNLPKNDFTSGINFAKENQLLLLFSMLYSVFDDQENALSLEKITFDDNNLENKRKELIHEWKAIEKSIKIIRHKLGFHSSKEIKGQKKACEQFQTIGDKPFDIINKLNLLYDEYIKKIK